MTYFYILAGVLVATIIYFGIKLGQLENDADALYDMLISTAQAVRTWDEAQNTQTERIDAMRNELDDLRGEFDAYSEEFGKCSDLIEAARQHEIAEEEAARMQRKSQEKIQDGINSILNYDYMTANKKGVSDNE